MSPAGNAQSQRLAIPQVPEPTLHDIEFARTSQRVYQLFHNPSAASQGRQSRLRVKNDGFVVFGTRPLCLQIATEIMRREATRRAE